MHAHTYTHTMTQNGGDYNYRRFQKLKETSRQVDSIFIYRSHVHTQIGATGPRSFSSQYKVTGRRQDPTVLHSYTAAACQERDA